MTPGTNSHCSWKLRRCYIEQDDEQKQEEEEEEAEHRIRFG